MREHGRKQALARAAWAQIQHMAGQFRRFEGLDWERVSRLVFACKGNICRSPYAETRARQLSWPATSLGLTTTAGAPADPVAIRLALVRGIDLRSHAARPAAAVPLGAGDLLAAMEPGHLAAVERLARKAGAQVTLLGLWRSPARPHIEDPFGLSEAYFATCFASIDAAIRGMLERRARSLQHGLPTFRPAG